MRQARLIAMLALLALGGCSYDSPVWWALEGGRLIVTPLVNLATEKPLVTESRPSPAGTSPLVTASGRVDTRPTEGYNPLSP